MTAGSSTKSKQESTMNADVIKGKWHQLKGEVKSRWGKLTDDDLDRVEGDSEKLIGKVQERYGCARHDAEREVNDFFDHQELLGGRHYEEAMARQSEPSPHFGGRAQPGDVIGVETGGEQTHVGETTEDENKRRRTAEDEFATGRRR
jgi:uncharacterized protein YjbJ (UPF0337 family)